jgi:5-oxoprolinase (ATP-hydrolysing) subunit A
VDEGFADRGYLPDGRLVPRGTPGALIDDHQAVVAQALSMARSGTVTATDGTVVGCPVESICVHGDTPGAVALARHIRDALESAGQRLAAFT